MINFMLSGKAICLIVAMIKRQYEINDSMFF